MKENEYNECHKLKRSFGKLVNRAAKALTKRLQKNFKAAGFDVTIEQWSMLLQLWGNDGQSQQELSICTDREKPCTTRLLDTMEKNNLVVRVPDKNDRRVNLIYLTHRGKKLRHGMIEQFQKTQAEALAEIDPDELALCIKVLNRITENLAEE